MRPPPSSFGPLGSGSGAAAPAGAGVADEFDSELWELPRPSRQGRTVTLALLLAGALASLAMVFALRRDVAYTLVSGTPTDLGDLRRVSPSALSASDNGFVRADGLLGAAGGIRYERPLRDDTFRALPVVGRDASQAVWVEIRVPEGEESGRWEPPRSFAGRLFRMDHAGPRHRGLPGAIERATGTRVPEASFLLVDGEEPSHARWALVLAALFLGVAMGNVAAMVRLARRVD